MALIQFRSYAEFAVFDHSGTRYARAGSTLLAQRNENRATIQLTSRSQLPDLASEVCETVNFECIFGLYHLLAGPYVALVRESENWVSIKKESVNVNIRRAKSIALYPLFLSKRELSESKQRDEEEYLKLIRKGFEMHNFFFSLDFDLTQSQQRIAKLNLNRGDRNLVGGTSRQASGIGGDGQAGGSTSNGSSGGAALWTRADARFFWNADLIGDLIACSADEWVVPFMSAYVELQPDCDVDGERFQFLFISRRSRNRQGTRFTKRGIDSQGNTANFVETEQILIFPNGKVTSYVQIRGSIPVLWSSPVHCKYDPKVYIDSMNDKSTEFATNHVKKTLELYSDNAGRSALSCVNLIDNKPTKDQGKLGMAFKKIIDGVKSNLTTSQAQRIRYTWWDFHAETKKSGKWANLAKLLVQCEGEFTAHRYFCKEANGVVSSWQKGVIRTNCMDNLDRTNVVQSLFARRSLLWQLDKAESKDVMNTPYKAFEKKYKGVWANNANAMSHNYAGIGALKVDFTKTGKVTMKGKYNDGINAVTRYFINNFHDGEKQDAIDILLGNFRPKFSNPSPFVTDPPFLLMAIFLMWLTFATAFALFLPLGRDAALIVQLHDAAKYSSFTTCAAVALHFAFMFKKGTLLGKLLARKPRLVLEFETM